MVLSAGFWTYRFLGFFYFIFPCFTCESSLRRKLNTNHPLGFVWCLAERWKSICSRLDLPGVGLLQTPRWVAEASHPPLAVPHPLRVVPGGAKPAGGPWLAPSRALVLAMPFPKLRLGLGEQELGCVEGWRGRGDGDGAAWGRAAEERGRQVSPRSCHPFHQLGPRGQRVIRSPQLALGPYQLGAAGPLTKCGCASPAHASPKPLHRPRHGMAQQGFLGATHSFGLKSQILEHPFPAQRVGLPHFCSTLLFSL